MSTSSPQKQNQRISSFGRIKLNYNSKYQLLHKKITEIEKCKTQTLAQLSKFFGELNKKIIKMLDKSQKSLQVAINISFNASLSKLYEICSSQNLSSLQIQKYDRKAQKVLSSYKLKYQQISEISTSVFNSIKQTLQKFRNNKYLKQIYQIKENSDILAYSHKKKINEPLESITTLNNKLVTRSANYVEINSKTVRHSLYKKVSFMMCVDLKKKGRKSEEQQIEVKEKIKKVLFCLQNQQILGLYSDKLVLLAYRKFQYRKSDIIGACQIGNHIYIAQKQRIIRINLLNLQQLQIKPFTNQIQIICNTAYHNMLIIYSNNMIQMILAPQLQIFHSISLLGVRMLRATKQHLLAIGLNGIKIYNGLINYHEMHRPDIEFVGAVPIGKEDVLLVTKNSQFIHYNIENIQKTQEHEYWSFLNLQFTIKGIKQLAASPENLIVLGQNGKYLYYFDY